MVTGTKLYPRGKFRVRMPALSLARTSTIWRIAIAAIATSVASIATLLPHFNRPLVLDEVEFIEAARGIQRYGVPVYYRGWIDTAGLIKVGSFHVHGLSGLSTVFKTSDGFITALQHGQFVDLVGNWHPELYLYLLALFLRLPVPVEVSARLLNLLCLEASAMLLFGIVDLTLARWRAAGSWRWVLPLIASLSYVLYPFTTRDNVLVDFTGTLSVTTVLLFWYVRLRTGLTWRGVAAQIIALALVPWSNLGPFPALVVALGGIAALECVCGPRRRGLMSLAVLGGGIALFYVTFEIYSLWSGLPAALTLQHNNAKLGQALALLPYPMAWRHGGTQFGTFLLWALTVGPAVVAAAAMYVMSHSAFVRTLGWKQGRVRIVTGLASLALTGVALVVYGAWQGIGVLRTAVVAVTSLYSFIRFLWALWLTVPHIEWLPVALAGCVVVLTIELPKVRQVATPHDAEPASTIKEMAIFAVVLATDLQLLGAQAWGFPKYEAPIFAVSCVALSLFVYTASSAPTAPRWAAFAALLLMSLGLLALLFREQPQLYGVNIAIPAHYRAGQLAAVLVLVAGMWASAGESVLAVLKAWRSKWSGYGVRASWIVAPALVLLAFAPLAVSGGREAAGLPGERGSLTYVEGTSWGVRAAGEYLHAHVQPGDQVSVRKDIGFYADVPYSEDYPWTAPIHPSAGTTVLWVSRPVSPGPGFVLMWRGPEYNVYRYTSPAHPTATK